MLRLLPDPRVSGSASVGAKAVSAVLWFVLVACSPRPAPVESVPLLVQTVVAELHDYSIDYSLTGEVVAREATDRAFRSGGKVTAVLVDVGDQVKKGDVLARMDPVQQQADVGAARAGLSAAEAQLRLAQAQFDRQKALQEQGFTSQAALDNAQAALTSATGAARSARAQLEGTRDALSNAVLVANENGVVTARLADPGVVVQAAQAIVTIASGGARDALFKVPEATFFRDFSADAIQLELVDRPGVTATARIREISPVVDPRDGTVRIKAEIINPIGEMTIGAAIRGTARTAAAKAFILPWTALDQAGHEPVVWVVDPQTGIPAARTVGLLNYEYAAVVIASGIAPGDIVVAAATQFLKHGQAVRWTENR